jgi:hypothetical protein
MYSEATKFRERAGRCKKIMKMHSSSRSRSFCNCIGMCSEKLSEYYPGTGYSTIGIGEQAAFVMASACCPGYVRDFYRF